MTKILRITEQVYKKILREFDENDDENSVESHEKKVKWLLNSGDEQNIELAFMLMDSLNLDKKALLRPYQETFEFLKKSYVFDNINSELEQYFELLTITKLHLFGMELKNIPTLNLPSVEFLNLEYNELSHIVNIQHMPNLKILNLKGNNISKEFNDFNDFSQLRQLKKLNLIDNNFTIHEPIIIKNMLPNTDVLF